MQSCSALNILYIHLSVSFHQGLDNILVTILCCYHQSRYAFDVLSIHFSFAIQQ